MAIYKFSCPECRKQFESESSVQWSVDQTAIVACQIGKPTKCTVYCQGEALPKPAGMASATPTIFLQDDPENSRQVAYLEVQSMDGGIHRLPVMEGQIQTYGRKSDFDVCDYPIDTYDKKMSRLHFQIESRVHNRQPSYIISDMGSVHGTRITRQSGHTTSTIQLYVNKEDKQLQDGICLEPDDLIMAGNTILRFSVDQQPEPPTTPGDDAVPEKFDPNRTTVF